MTPLSVSWSPAAKHELRPLDRQLVGRVRGAVRRYAETGHGDVKRLQGPVEEYRLRVGDVRVRFRLDRTRRLVEVLHVQPRGRAYRD